MKQAPKHIVIDARIRRASTGRPVDRLLKYLPDLDKINRYTILVEPTDEIVLSGDNFTTLPCPYRQFSFNIIKQLSYSWFLYRLRPDLVFFTMTSQAPLFYFGKNITFTHDLTMLRFARAGRLPQWLHEVRMVGYRLLFWKGNNQAKKIIVPSKFVAEDLMGYSASLESKIVVIYESSEPAFADKALKPVISGFKKPFILHVGSPFPHKNINRLVEAFEKLKPANPQLQLVLCGKKEYYFGELEKWLTGRKYTKDIFITGFVTDGELKWLYQNAECYVWPSLSEGFGLPGLEAMAHQCPLVSSDRTCLPEVYGEAAHYFNPENTDDMKHKIQEVLTSKKLRENLVKNGNKQLSKYSWQKMTREIHGTILENL